MKKSFLFMLMMLATISTMRANNILVVYFRWGGQHTGTCQRDTAVNGW